MILLSFILGIALIFGIARYNESNKLFWTLLFAYMIGFVGTSMVVKAVRKSNVSSTQVCPIQTPTGQTGIDIYYLPDTILQDVEVVTAQPSVSQDVPVMSKEDVTKVFMRTRDQPVSIKPFELYSKWYFNTS